MAENKPSAWKTLAPKAKAIGQFAKHTVNHEESREELKSFLERMKISSKEVNSDLADDSNKSEYYVRRRSTAPHIRNVPCTNKILKPPVSILTFIFFLCPLEVFGAV